MTAVSETEIRTRNAFGGGAPLALENESPGGYIPEEPANSMRRNEAEPVALAVLGRDFPAREWLLRGYSHATSMNGSMLEKSSRSLRSRIAL